MQRLATAAAERVLTFFPEFRIPAPFRIPPQQARPPRKPSKSHSPHFSPLFSHFPLTFGVLTRKLPFLLYRLHSCVAMVG